MKTSIGVEVHSRLLHNYFGTLVNQVYKILPMREHDSKTLNRYIRRLSAEIVGGSELYPNLCEDAYYASLLNILQYLQGHCMEDSIDQTKQLVFEGIHLCEKLKERYADEAAAVEARMEKVGESDG